MTVTLHLILGSGMAIVGFGGWLMLREDITQETSHSKGWGCFHSFCFLPMFIVLGFLGLGVAFAPTATLWLLDQLGNAALGGLKP